MSLNQIKFLRVCSHFLNFFECLYIFAHPVPYRALNPLVFLNVIHYLLRLTSMQNQFRVFLSSLNRSRLPKQTHRSWLHLFGHQLWLEGALLIQVDSSNFVAVIFLLHRLYVQSWETIQTQILWTHLFLRVTIDVFLAHWNVSCLLKGFLPLVHLYRFFAQFGSKILAIF